MITFTPHTRKDILARIGWLNNHKDVLYATSEPDRISTEKNQNKWFDDYEEKLAKGTKIFFTITRDNISIGFMGLSDINKKVGSASVFILIGENKYHGSGRGEKSMVYLINYAFEELNLKSLYLEVDKENNIAISLYNKLGFQKLVEDSKFITMSLSRNTLLPIVAAID